MKPSDRRYRSAQDAFGKFTTMDVKTGGYVGKHWSKLRFAQLQTARLNKEEEARVRRTA